GKWSKKEILGHLIDSALTNQRRFIVSQYEQGTKIIYFQDEWVELQFYQTADVNDLIELWRLLNLQIARTVENIPTNKLKNLCDTGRTGYEPHDIDFLITDYITHLRHHLQHIVS
ncbi:MAG TPA: DinB family protein, partial [Chitinophagaceae bacterium]|nr:DinB family protein [Chitinophagaceae bacterium]